MRCFARFWTIIGMFVISTGIDIFQNEQISWCKNIAVSNQLQHANHYCLWLWFWFCGSQTMSKQSTALTYPPLQFPSGKAKLQVLQDAWTECQGNWSTSNFYKKITGRSTVSEQGCRRWMTRAQLVRKYDSSDYADHIIAAKNRDEELRETHVKDHPDAPGVEAGSMGCGIWDAAGLKFVWETVHVLKLHCCFETSDDLSLEFGFTPLTLSLFFNHLS